MFLICQDKIAISLYWLKTDVCYQSVLSLMFRKYDFIELKIKMSFYKLKIHDFQTFLISPINLEVYLTLAKYFVYAFLFYYCYRQSFIRYLFWYDQNFFFLLNMRKRSFNPVVPSSCAIHGGRLFSSWSNNMAIRRLHNVFGIVWLISRI